ncbi:MAG: iron-containing alcohol dehydrogenase [Christensenellaceae bacterium]|jgi:alcohol dehydrogenase class IV|nr:iron-containing alcohol dehydrogenase [Christensenellaceae bacterium]
MEKSFPALQMGQLVCGRGSIAFLKTLQKQRVAVLYDSRVFNERARADLCALLGGDVRFIADILGEPTLDDIRTAVNALGDFAPELFVAIGGGSVMDVTKAVWLLYEHPQLDLADAFKPFQLPAPAGKADIAAVPTTSGTGSETTCCAVFTNTQTQEKQLMLGFEIVPKYAILDPNFTDTLPGLVAAHTGMDALSHAMEAAVCKAASPLVISIALGATLDLLENLPLSVNEGEGRKAYAREQCHYAATMAGVAINNCSAGLVHALDQPGPYFGLPHGLVCGLLLPYTTAFHSPHPVYAQMAGRLGFAGSEAQRCAQLVDYLWAFQTKVGVAHSFKELGVDEAAFMDRLAAFAAVVDTSMAARLSPRQPTQVEAAEILRAAYYGERPAAPAKA